MEEVLKENEDIALSGQDILDLLNGQTKIVLYRNLDKFENIDELLAPHDNAMILFESKPSYGHWCLLFRRPDQVIEFFNPYGGYPFETLDHVPDDFRKKSNQHYPWLDRLLYDSPYKLEYNEFPFQKLGPNIRTCGRWCVARLLFGFMTLEEFADLFHNKYGDKLVTFLTNIRGMSMK